MAEESNYIEALNAGDESPGNVSYTSVYTLFDEMVIPQVPESTSKLDGARNVLIQDLCPGRPVDHVGLSTADAVGYWLTLDAFTHPGPADPARFDIATCAQVLMPGADTTQFNGEGSADFNGDYVEAEPPLKAYAIASSASDGGQESPRGAPADDGAEPEHTPTVFGIEAEEVPVGETDVEASSLPNSGANVLRMIATAFALIAAGLTLNRHIAAHRFHARMRSSRSAERRILPASSRSASDTNS